MRWREGTKGIVQENWRKGSKKPSSPSPFSQTFLIIHSISNINIPHWKGEGGCILFVVMSRFSEWKWRRSMVETACELRKNMTDSEKILWEALRSRRFKQFKFRRQVPIDRFIVDFLCIPLHLVIELDGEIHNEQKEHDAEREECLRQMGYQILRFRNDEVIQNLNNVLDKIEASLWRK